MEKPTDSLRPFLIGRGRAGSAIVKALDLLRRTDPDLRLEECVLLPREADFGALPPNAVLCVANPHALHPETLERAARAGVRYALCEKPLAVSMGGIERLRRLEGLEVAVFHGYRVQWGIQALARRLAAGELGQVFRIEIRYWQSSAAQRALTQQAPATTAPVPAASAPPNWKNDRALAGDHDTVVDLGTHALDLASFLAGRLPISLVTELLHVNAEAPHRDTHAEIRADFGAGLGARLSASKAVHGAGNDLEVVVLGTKAAATWRFQQPDQLEIGAGRERRILARDTATGSGFTPFHGLGWIEGYFEIARRALRQWRLGERADFPELRGSLDLAERLLASLD